MQALLSFDQAPPFSAPIRFFLTAPLFAILAALLILWEGPDLFVSRWTAATLALTHLITVGFMLQAMLGAMIQILPVVAGANIARPRFVAAVVHLAIGSGALCLSAGFLGHPPFFNLAALCLGVGTALFAAAAAWALYSVQSTNPTIRGLKLSLIGLAVTVMLGLLLSIALGESLALPLLQLTSIHLAWGVVAWSIALLAAVALVVVPMFQLTPAYPADFARRFCWAAIALPILWSLVDLLGWQIASTTLASAMALLTGTFALQTLRLQSQGTRARFDASQQLWRVGMICLIAACGLWLLARFLPMLGDRREWPLLCGILVFVGGFMSVIVGMFYKIVPFLVWLHLQNRSGGRILAPNMNKVIAGWQIERQMHAHFLSLATLLTATLFPGWLAYPAGLLLLLANTWLLRNLVAAIVFYRRHCAQIDATISASP